VLDEDEPWAEPARFGIDPASFSPSCRAVGDNGGTGLGLPPEAESACADIIVSEPPAATYGADVCTAQSKLLVYLPGSDFGPAGNRYVQDMAAFAGFRTVGLSYLNSYETADFCRDRNIFDTDYLECNLADYTTECSYFIREERITGDDHPLTDFGGNDPDEWELAAPMWPQDGIAYRLLFTLLALDQFAAIGADCAGSYEEFYDDLDNTVFIEPDPLGQGDFLLELNGAHPMDLLRWENIVVGGWSQGSGQANLIALENEVGGLFLLDGNSDYCYPPNTPNVDWLANGASYYEGLFAGPIDDEPRFGVWHAASLGGGTGPGTDARPLGWDNDLPDVRDDPLDPADDPYATLSHDGPLAGLILPISEDQDWDTTLAVSVDPILHETRYPLNSGFSPPAGPFRGMTLVTAAAPAGSCSAHNSVAVSSNALTCMPDATGAPAADASQAQLFEAYVRAFCKLGQP
jgi:hypothetical protein